jgi:RluA family pseudouridine synthase
MSRLDLRARVLHRDAVVIVIDKPAGIVVHPRPGARGAARGESLEDYFVDLKFGLKRAPALAHRLDRDTTGCLVLGRHPKALRKLHTLFSAGLVDKTYWAICRGAPARREGSIDAPLKKSRAPDGWRMSTCGAGEAGALAARTDYRLLAAKGGFAFIEAQPKTGRTHQIRVHLAAIGAPIVGDPQYGDLSAADRARAMMLHARRVVLPIAASRPPVDVTAPAPAAMRALCAELGLPVPADGSSASCTD